MICRLPPCVTQMAISSPPNSGERCCRATTVRGIGRRGPPRGGAVHLNVDPRAWLADVIARLPAHPVRREGNLGTGIVAAIGAAVLVPVLAPVLRTVARPQIGKARLAAEAFTLPTPQA